MTHPHLGLNSQIRLPDGRVGTICWKHLDGVGGVWGQHTFTMPAGGFGDELPAPEFMLREKAAEDVLRRNGHRADLECVGDDYERLATAGEGR